MPTTIFTAQPYDEAKARRRTIAVVVSIVAVIVIAILLWFNRYWPEEHVAKHFFSQLQSKNYEGAYGTWLHDPDWKQHPEKYKQYTFHAFYLDWGPSGEWGNVNSYKIVGAVRPQHGTASGVAVGVRVNERKTLCTIRVEIKDKTMGFSPDDMVE